MPIAALTPDVMNYSFIQHMLMKFPQYPKPCPRTGDTAANRSARALTALLPFQGGGKPMIDELSGNVNLQNKQVSREQEAGSLQPVPLLRWPEGRSDPELSSEQQERTSINKGIVSRHRAGGLESLG